MNARSRFVLASSFSLFALPAASDVVHLKNGGTLRGEVTENSDTIVVMAKWGRVVLPRSDVVRIEKEDPPEKQYAARRAAMQSPSAADWIELARWCDANGLASHAREAYNEALQQDPNNETARRALGYEIKPPAPSPPPPAPVEPPAPAPANPNDGKEAPPDPSAKQPPASDHAGVVSGQYGGRIVGAGKRDLVLRAGGTRATEGAVHAGLRWLARHQGEHGFWDSDAFRARCGKILPGGCGGPGGADYDIGVTALALLAFLGAGYTPQSTNTYDGICFGDVVKKGLQWLIAVQDNDGCVGGRSTSKYMYNHSIASLALCEAFALTQDDAYKESAQKSINFLQIAQNPGKAWRYKAQCGDNDTSVTAWCVMALRSAESSHLRLPPSGYRGARMWLDEVTTSDNKAGYTARGTGHIFIQGKNEHYEHHEALTAAAVMSRIFIDKNRSDPRTRGGVALLVADLPVWDGAKVDFYYWYYASLALFQFDGPDGPNWSAWNEKMKTALVKNQMRSGDNLDSPTFTYSGAGKAVSGKCTDGSWNPIDRWGCEGGRVYATAINVLTLEVYYRYKSAFGGRIVR
jgi:hypothetical protein